MTNQWEIALRRDPQMALRLARDLPVDRAKVLAEELTEVNYNNNRELIEALDEQVRFAQSQSA